MKDSNHSIVKGEGKDVDSDSDTSFEKKLELMKAELEELENDFSAKTLDNLTKYSFDDPKVSKTDEKGVRIGDDLNEMDNYDNKRPKTPQRNRKDDLAFIPFDAISE